MSVCNVPSVRESSALTGAQTIDRLSGGESTVRGETFEANEEAKEGKTNLNAKNEGKPLAALRRPQQRMPKGGGGGGGGGGRQRLFPQSLSLSRAAR